MPQDISAVVTPPDSAAGYSDDRTPVIRIRQADEAFDRFQLLASGKIRVGDGSAAPAAVSTYTQTYSTANRTVAAPTAVAAGLSAQVAITGGEDPTEAEFNALLAQVNLLITAVTALIADDLDNRQSISALIDDLQAGGLAQ